MIGGYVVLINSRGTYDTATAVGDFHDEQIAQEVADTIEEKHSVECQVAYVENAVPQWLELGQMIEILSKAAKR